MSVESPCIKVCTLDASGTLCLGCFRTLDEIGQWAGLSDPQRRRILDQLPARQARSSDAAMGPANGTALRCERCGAGFVCGAKDREHPCWCMSYPPAAPSPAATRCLCPQCLASAARA